VAHDVFISHSSHDSATANAACAMIERRGIRCWIAPRDLTPGLDWSGQIVEALEQSAVVVLVYSAHANGSHQVKREVERGVSLGLPLIPMRIDDAPMSKALEFFASSPHWLDAMTPPLERHLQQLAETVEYLVKKRTDKRPRTAPPPPPARPRARRSLLVGAAAVVLAGAGAAAWLALRPPPALDPPLVGTWGLTTTDQRGTTTGRLTIARSGAFDLVMRLEDQGRIEASNGRYRMVSQGGTRVSGSYTPKGPAVMAITGAAGTADWTRAQGSATGSDLTGEWTTGGVVDGIPVSSALSVRPNGTYTFVVETPDRGTMTARNGVWEWTSSLSGKTTAGTYRLPDSRALSLTGPLGTGLWTRR